MALTNIASVVRAHASETPDSVAIIFGDREITWRELDERSNRVAQALLRAGVSAGDRVARIDKNGLDYFELLFAAGKINAVLVDVNWRLAPAELRQVVADSEAKVLFLGDEYAGALDAILESAPSLQVVALGQGDDRRVPLDDWLGDASTEDPGADPGMDDVCLQLYTSGTTGLPKGVMLANRNLFSFIGEVAPQWFMSKESISMVVMPLFHIAGSGWALVSLSTGCRVVLHREIDPSAILRDIEARKVTHAIFVPALLAFMQIVPDAHDHDLSSMELVAYGASPITEEVLRGAMQQFADAKFVQLYGLTETTGASVQLGPEDHDPDNKPELLRAAGKPYPWLEIRVVGDDGEELEEGEIGELWMRGPSIMVGYWNKPEETARALTEDGWFKTGDAGYLKDGYVYLHDRVKDMIVTGGENVYPAEVENAIMGCPGVADVAVIGVPDEKWGEAVKAIVVKKPGDDVDQQTVIDWARERIAGFKVPKSVDFAESLPRNPTGKILKKDLRAPYWEGRDRQIG